ncbi:MAG: IS5 family transposase ISHch3 [bacterium]|nr:IS5 family transposase ISHch3 [bacterium]
MVIAAANVPDAQLLQETLEAVVVCRPEPTPEEPQHLCLDKGYDNPRGQAAIEQAGYTPHVRRIGEEKFDTRKRKRHRARRWVVERTLSWLQKWRGILVRYNKKAENFLGAIQLACALLWFRRLYRLSLLR